MSSAAPPPPPGEDSPPGPASPAPWMSELTGATPPPAWGTADAPPAPSAYRAAPAPAGRGRGWHNRRLILVLGVIALVVVAAVIGAAVSASHSSRLPLVSSQSTDGTFHSGDCVSLSATRVTRSDCGGAHDAQIIQVIQAGQTCPAGTKEFDVNDGTGNLCLDTGNNSKG